MSKYIDIKGSKMLSREDFKLFGLSNYEEVVMCHNAMKTCMRDSIIQMLENGSCLPDNQVCGMTLFMDFIFRMDKARLAYLARHIKALEEECGLEHDTMFEIGVEHLLEKGGAA